MCPVFCLCSEPTQPERTGRFLHERREYGSALSVSCDNDEAKKMPSFSHEEKNQALHVHTDGRCTHMPWLAVQADEVHTSRRWFCLMSQDGRWG